LPPPGPFPGGHVTARLERRGDRFRAVFRFRGERFHVNLKAADDREADACLARLEENLRFVERGRLAVPPGADLGLLLLSDGKLERPVEVAKPVRLVEMFGLHRAELTAGAKETITPRPRCRSGTCSRINGGRRSRPYLG
jgi:hypothetical protein